MCTSSWFWIIVAGVAVSIAENYRQEQAAVRYANPKYVQNAQAFTGRQKRGYSYKTNFTATLIKPWANNVTFELSYKTKGSPTPLTISIRICDIFKTKWMADFLRSYSNVKFVCPLPAGMHSIINMEVPPKNFPLPIPKGELRVNITYYVTDTKEMIMQCALIMHHV